MQQCWHCRPSLLREGVERAVILSVPWDIGLPPAAWSGHQQVAEGHQPSAGWLVALLLVLVLVLVALLLALLRGCGI